jgi:hypothetical protein
MWSKHPCLFIDPNTFIRLHAFWGSSKFRNLVSRVWNYHRFMASSHLTESGPIITSLHVVGSSLSNNNDSFSNLTIWLLPVPRGSIGTYISVTTTFEAREPCALWPPLGHFPALRYSAHIAQVQQPNQSSIVLPLNFSWKISSQETWHFQRQTLLSSVFWRNTQHLHWDNLQRLTYLNLVVNILHMPSIPIF